MARIKRMRRGGTEDTAAKNKVSREGARDVPYVKCYQETGMIEVMPGVFTHGYEIRPPKFQKAITYSVKKVRECMKKIFSSFGEMSFQFVIRNSPTEKEEYLKTVQLPHGRSVEVNECTDLYNALIAENVDVGHNNFVRHIYLVVSAVCGTADEAAERFGELDGVIEERFFALYSYVAEPLSLKDRLRGLYGIYHPGMDQNADGIFDRELSFKSMKRARCNTKEMVAPESVVYERDFIRLGHNFLRMLFINSFPTSLPDSLLCDLTAVSGNSILSVSYIPVESDIGYGAAKAKVDKNTDTKIVPIRETVEDRRSRRTETVTSPILENESEYFHKAALSVFEGAVEKGEPLLLSTFLIALIADSKEELDRDTALLRLSASKYACQVRSCDLLQNEAFQSVLPLDHIRVDYGRMFALHKISSVFPLDVQHLFEQKPMFQGLNQINDNFIFADRRNCPIGLIAGIEKSGKTFAVKRDAMNALMTSEDMVFILTKMPEEYLSFAKHCGGALNYFQPDPFIKDRDYALGDDGGMFRKLFLEAVMTLVSSYYKGKLLLEEKGEKRKRITGEAEMLTYQGFMELPEALLYAREKPEAFPMFLSAFGDRVVTDPEEFKRVNILPCVDDVDMLFFMDYLWNYAIGAKKNNRNIWIYVDGMDSFLYSDVCSDYLLSLIDKAARLRVPMTFVLDDSVHVVTDQDASIEFDYFLNRMQYFKLLSQGPIERKRYEERLNISRTLIPYITDREPGEGILITPSLNAAFTDRFERDSDFYRLFY